MIIGPPPQVPRNSGHSRARNSGGYASNDDPLQGSEHPDSRNQTLPNPGHITSVTKAVNTIPDQVGTLGDVDYPQLVGPGRGEVALDQVRRLPAAGSGRVVTNERPRRTPRSPLARISRSTWQRATTVPSRRSWCHNLRAP